MALNLPSRTGVGLVRRLLPDIEAALREGATLDQVHVALQSEYELALNFDSFKNALYRARKDSKGKDGKPETHHSALTASRDGEWKEPPAPDKKPEAPRKKRGIISPKDFRASPDIEEELNKLTSKKYD